MSLKHTHIPRLIPYTRASTLQDRLVAAHLAHKRLPTPSSTPAPPPTLITWTSNPTYTLGRRETLKPSQETYLSASGAAAVHGSQRGGQTTFHGPGQLVGYLILDLRRHGLGPRSYVCLLEGAVMRTCARWGISSKRTENPGVWVTEERKIAALGVHLRRNVASHGVAVNVSTDLAWFDRIVACGLPGKGATSFEREGVRGVEVAEVGRALAEEIAGALEGVDGVEEQDVHESGEEEKSWEKI